MKSRTPVFTEGPKDHNEPKIEIMAEAKPLKHKVIGIEEQDDLDIAGRINM